jgi:glycosyltransferase involved in cell wall biosynthesis
VLITELRQFAPTSFEQKITTTLGIVVPCYNEEEVLPETGKRLLELMDRLQAADLIKADSSIYFVDDGSKDKTWEIIQELAQRDSRIHGVKLSRNKGHQNALLAGLSVAKGEALVTVDADLQDDINVIQEMVKLFLAGTEIVYGVRRSRATDTAFKRGTAQIYYKLLEKMGVEIVYNHADYRLMSRRAVEHLQEYSEVNLFLRGIVPLLGYNAATVYYDRTERFAGESKYPLRRMLALAFDGITSFSVTPLRFIAAVGVVVFIASFGMVAWVMYGRLFMNTAIPGWASSVIPIYFLGGIQLLSIGVLGEYVAKIYLETKRRPRFAIEKVL